MSALSISEFARAGGVGVETVRYYQRRGLLAVPPRAHGAIGGGIRRYDERDVGRLRFIRSAQAAGFTLEEIGELLALDGGWQALPHPRCIRTSAALIRRRG